VDRYHHGNLKAALLKAAFQLVGKIGLEGFTLREVARRAGVSHNAPYRHFKSKEDLLAALAISAFEQLNAALQNAVKGCEDHAGPAPRLRAASRAYLEFGLAHPARFHAMFHSRFDRESYPEYVAHYRAALALLDGLLLACNPSGNPDSESASELLWATIHGITELGIAKRLEHGEPSKLTALVDSAVDVLLRGMRTTDGST